MIYKNKIKCEICEKHFGIISPTHLKKHNISMVEYKKLYPESLIVSENVSKKLSDNAKNNENIGFKKGCKHKIRVTWNKGLTKETDKRVKLYSEKLINKSFSEEHKKKISVSKTKHESYQICQKCGKIKSKTTRKLCGSCSQQIRVCNFSNPMKGRKLTDEHKKKLLIIQNKSINKPEKKILDSYGSLGLKYTGDRSKWVTFKDGKVKNPDFVFENYNICIEAYGNYWHRNDDPKLLINKYEEIGWRCLVLWEKEINENSLWSLSEIINQFINYDNYFPYCNIDDDDYGGRWW